MRFLADESCDFAVIRALRSTGHDVLAVAEFQQRSVDQELMELAYAQHRVLLTEDKDFGWITYVMRAKCPGVILIRFPGGARRTLAAAITRLIHDHEAELGGSFVVVQPGSFRISRPPVVD